MHGTDLAGPTDGLESSIGQLTDGGESHLFFGSSSTTDDNISPVRWPVADDYLAGQDSERRRLGRELHDSTGQLLVALSLSVAHLRHSHDAAQSEEILREIDDTVRQIDQEIRTFSFLNYPAELGKCGLVGALDMLVRGFGNRTGVRIDFQSSCKQPCSGNLASALLRVAQEALTNVHRHAKATRVRVALEEHHGMLELSVRDDGRGMPPAGHPALVNGVGLQGMRHRVERLGGRFAIRRLKQGTKVLASLRRCENMATAAA